MKRIASIALMLLAIAGCDRIENPENPENPEQPEQPEKEKMYVNTIEIKLPDYKTTTNHTRLVRYNYNGQDQISSSKEEVKYHNSTLDNPDVYRYREGTFNYTESGIEEHATYSYEGWENIYDEISGTIDQDGRLNHYEVVRRLSTQEEPITGWEFEISYEDSKIQKISGNDGAPDRIFTWGKDVISTIKMGNENSSITDEFVKFSKIVNNTNLDLNVLLTSFYGNLNFIPIQDAAFMNCLGKPFNNTLIENYRRTVEDKVDPSNNMISEIHFEYVIDEDDNISEINVTETRGDEKLESKIRVTYI